MVRVAEIVEPVLRDAVERGTAAGLDGLEADVLIAAEQATPVDDLQRTRGWTADDWHAAVVR